MEKTSTPHPSRRMPRPRAASHQQVEATLDDIRRIIGVGTQPVAEVLPEAIAQANEDRAPALTAALEPAVARSLRVVAARDSQWFGEMLAPTIGVAVRKAVSEALAALMQRFNEALERSLSFRSFQWRLEARRTGLPFAEVVLLHTLIYRVEQVFLMHAETGLVLQHVVAEGVTSSQPDQVASMLSAIDAFGREAFSPSPPGVYLHEFSLGDLTVWVDRAGPIALALVIRGRAPRALLDVLTETRERILLECRESLANFEADTTPFRATEPILEQCLQERRKQAPQRGPVILIALALGIAIGIGALVSTNHQQNVLRETRLEAYRQALSAQPGIIVTSASRQGERYRLGGLRDPLAPEPAQVVAGLGPGRPELAFQPFYSLDSRLVEARVRRVLSPPETVSVAVRGGTLELAGDAPRAWIERAVTVASALPGIERVQSTLSDSTVRELATATRELAGVEVSFAVGSAELEPDAEGAVARARGLIGEIERLSAGVQQQSCLSVIGDTDASGPPAKNSALARQRAQAVATAIQQDSALRALRLELRGRRETDAFPRARSVHFAGGCAEGVGK